ncbi:hypothetical protein Tco_0388581 [Tanacetum coccineum]
MMVEYHDTHIGKLFSMRGYETRLSGYEFGRRKASTVRYVGPFEIVNVYGPFALSKEVTPGIYLCPHDTVSCIILKKCLAEPDVQVPLDEIEIDENLRFVEEPIEIVERDVKKLKRRRIHLVKVRWNSRQGARIREREEPIPKK